MIDGDIKIDYFISLLQYTKDRLNESGLLNRLYDWSINPYRYRQIIEELMSASNGQRFEIHSLQKRCQVNLTVVSLPCFVTEILRI